MGQGEEAKTKIDAHVEIQERGEIFFFYRPKVGKEAAHGLDDVQRLYIVLRPESGEKPVEEKRDTTCSEAVQEESGRASENKSQDVPNSGVGTQEVNIEKQPLMRFIIMGRKSLPDPSKRSHRPYWGFVEMVTTCIEDVKTALEGEEYDTRTSGHRHSSPARAVGEGIYRILRHESSSGSGTSKSSKKVHTHLVYKLEFPVKDHENGPQESLNIKREGSFIIQIKNPNQRGDSGGQAPVWNKRKAIFPSHLQGSFGQLRWAPADPPDLLNFEGCEFLLIAASDDLDEEMGLDLKTDSSCCDLVCTFGEDAATSTSPLFKGAWA